MMFTQTGDFNVTDYDHLIVIFCEDGVVDDI